MRTFASLCVSCSALLAQGPETAASLRQALAKDDAVKVAWAAHEARKLGDKQLAKPLLEALATWRQRDGRDSRLACLYLLDALVGLQPKAPATDAVALLDDPVCGVAAFVLVAREPLHNEAQLLAMFRSDWENVKATDNTLPPRTEGLGALLAAQRVPGLAALVAERVDFGVELVVTDARGSTGQGGTFDFGFGREDRLDAAWPPYPKYRFRDLTQAVGTRWQPVPLPKPLDRLVTRELLDWQEKVSSFSLVRADEPTRWPGVDWLCEMAGLARRERATSVRFTKGDAFVAQVTAAREARRELLATLKEKLVANGAMTADEAKVFDKSFASTVTDQRGNTSVALPAIPK